MLERICDPSLRDDPTRRFVRARVCLISTPMRKHPRTLCGSREPLARVILMTDRFDKANYPSASSLVIAEASRADCNVLNDCITG